MSKPFKQSFRTTSPSFLTLLFVIVFTFVLSGCGGSGGGSTSMTDGEQQMPDGGQQMPDGGQQMPGGGGQEPVSRELLLNKINEIQATERADNSDDDVATDILRTAANQPRGRTSSALGPTISSTSQNSGTTSEITNARASFVAEYDADGMLHFSMRRITDGGDVTNRSTKDQGATVNRVEGIPAAGWKGVVFQGESTSWHQYVDLFSDIENNEDSDYLVLGFWLRERKERSTRSNYTWLVAASGNDPFESSNVAGLTGTATYEGPATGLYMLKANAAAEPELDYFNAKANLTADFGDATALGSVSGRITSGMTEEGDALPEVTLGSANIQTNISSAGRGGNYSGNTSGMTDAGVAFSGKWGGKFYSNGASATDHPGAVAGTFGAKTADDLQAIIGAFGAYKQ